MNCLTKLVSLKFASAVLALSSISAFGGDARMIATQFKNKDHGFKSAVYELEMQLKKNDKVQNARKLTIHNLENVSGANKSKIMFTFPPEIRGSALLTHPNGDSNSLQWLYLPSLKRVKRINSSNKASAFLGSEFTFEDLTDTRVDDFTYKYVSETKCVVHLTLRKSKSSLCDVIVRKPISKDSGYSKQMLTIERNTHRLIEIQYFNKMNVHIKTFTTKDFQLIDSKYWRPMRTIMINHLNGKSTELKYSSATFGLRLGSSDFDRNSFYRY